MDKSFFEWLNVNNKLAEAARLLHNMDGDEETISYLTSIEEPEGLYREATETFENALEKEQAEWDALWYAYCDDVGAKPEDGPSDEDMQAIRDWGKRSGHEQAMKSHYGAR